MQVVLRATIPGLLLVSEANSRSNRFEKARRNALRRGQAAMILSPNKRPPVDVGLLVTITRVAPDLIRDDDNLTSSAKSVRDGIADWLDRGGDSSATGITFRVEQRVGPVAVEITIATVEISQEKRNDLTRRAKRRDQRRDRNAKGRASEASAPNLMARRNTVSKAGAWQVRIASAGRRAR